MACYIQNIWQKCWDVRWSNNGKCTTILLKVISKQSCILDTKFQTSTKISMLGTGPHLADWHGLCLRRQLLVTFTVNGQFALRFGSAINNELDKWTKNLPANTICEVFIHRTLENLISFLATNNGKDWEQMFHNFTKNNFQNNHTIQLCA